MKKTVELFFLILLCFVSITSCRRENFSITDCEVSSYTGNTGETFLSVNLLAEIPDLKKTVMTVTDPSGNLFWTVKPEKTTMDGINYIGYEAIAMPKGLILPSGVWSVELVYQDGRTVSKVFEVYSDYSSDVLE